MVEYSAVALRTPTKSPILDGRYQDSPAAQIRENLLSIDWTRYSVGGSMTQLNQSIANSTAPWLEGLLSTTCKSGGVVHISYPRPTASFPRHPGSSQAPQAKAWRRLAVSRICTNPSPLVANVVRRPKPTVTLTLVSSSFAASGRSTFQLTAIEARWVFVLPAPSPPLHARSMI